MVWDCVNFMLNLWANSDENTDEQWNFLFVS